jgi:serine phosphatase RsbU (regulator of sigma subunit)
VAVLAFQNGSRSGEQLVLDHGRLIIGRHPDCEIVLDIASVSRQHAALTVTADGVTIEDLRSRNGTIVNDVRIASPRPLEDGDVVSICGQRLVFDADAGSQRSVTIDAIDAGFDDDGEAELEPASDAVIMSQVAMPRLSGDDELGRHTEAKLRAVLGLNRAIGGSLSLDEVLPRMLDGLLEVFPQADRGFVLLAQPPTGKLKLRARRMKRTDDGPVRLSRTLIDRVAASRQAILSADAATDSRFHSTASVMVGCIRSVMAVPVTGGDGRLLGVLQVDSRDLRGGFSEADLDVLAGIAGHAAQAIEQAIAHEERVEREQLARDLELAHRVQQGLLPSRPPDVPGYEIFDFYEPARLVGGDFFSYVPLPGGRMAVVLADVSGKGVAAALLMAAVSADIRYCLASEPDLARAVSLVNESFLRGGWDDRFATLVVAVLDPSRHAVEICNAGHLPVFLRDSRGVRQVADDLGGLPLGMHAGHEFHSCTVDLPPGSAFVVCTDGVTEAMDHADTCYGLEQLEAVMAKSAASANDIGRRILADVERHVAGAAVADDICLVCVRRQAAGEPA